MTYPKSVKINHRRHKIKWLPNDQVFLDDAERVGVQHECFGICSHDEMLIRIQEDRSRFQQAETLLHEIIHALDYSAGNTLQEAEVLMLAIGITGVMRDNPAVCKFIFGDEKG